GQGLHVLSPGQRKRSPGRSQHEGQPEEVANRNAKLSLEHGADRPWPESAAARGRLLFCPPIREWAARRGASPRDGGGQLRGGRGPFARHRGGAGGYGEPDGGT